MSQRSVCWWCEIEGGHRAERIRASHRSGFQVRRSENGLKRRDDTRTRGERSIDRACPNRILLVSRPRGWRPDHPVACSGVPLHPSLLNCDQYIARSERRRANRLNSRHTLRFTETSASSSASFPEPSLSSHVRSCDCSTRHQRKVRSVTHTHRANVARLSAELTRPTDLGRMADIRDCSLRGYVAAARQSAFPQRCVVRQRLGRRERLDRRGTARPIQLRI